MNIHPLFVHFPIALLTTYAVFELVNIKRITQCNIWFYLKGTLVIIGAFTAQLSLATGEEVQKMFRDDPEKNAIVPVHALWAGLSASIFLVLAFSYAILWIKYEMPSSFFENKPRLKRLHDALIHPAVFFARKPYAPMLAATGLLSITITGALGGAMVHGIDVDPFVTFVYRLFF